MKTIRSSILVLATLAVTMGPLAVAARAQTIRSNERTERFTRDVRLGPNGRFTLGNIAGRVIVTGSAGDRVLIEAVKRTRGSESELADVTIDVQERSGRVSVETKYRQTGRRNNNSVSVDYTITVPRDADTEIHSVSGVITVSDVRGSIDAETISGSVSLSRATGQDVKAKSVSGSVELTDLSLTGDVAASSISGGVRIRSVKARGVNISTISGRVDTQDLAADRVKMESMSGPLDFGGMLMRNGRYDMSTHSGRVRVVLSGSMGFDLDANSFSGSITSDFPVLVSAFTGRRGPRLDRSIHGTFGDGSASVSLHSFSGGITIQRR